MDSSLSKRDNTRPSCTTCQRRKVKCDRQQPCNACTKSGLECEFAERTLKRRRISQDPALTKSHSEVAISGGQASSSRTRIRRSPNLRSLRASEPASNTEYSDSGSLGSHLVPDGKAHKYVNNYIWNALPKSSLERQDSTRAQTGINESEQSEKPVRREVTGTIASKTTSASDINGAFVLGNGQSGNAGLHLPPQHVVILWHKYIQNVDPVMKVVHVPTVQQLVLSRIEKTTVTVQDNPLVASIFFVSAVSLTDTECRDLLQLERGNFVQDLRNATEKALSSAGFVTTNDIITLQALALYLIALYSLGETRTVWGLLGLAARIAGRLGLAEDGADLSLPPFECEMRRRLWWALIYVDARTAEMIGQPSDLLIQPFNVHPPSNLSDSELFASMKTVPKSRQGATDAIYVVQRATYGSYLHSTPVLARLTRGPTSGRMANFQLGEAVKEIKKLESHFVEDFIKHYDPSVPLQQFASISARSFINKLHLIAKSSTVTNDDFSAEVFALSLQLMELQLSLWTEPNLQQWRWYWAGHFLFYGFIILIRQTRLCQSRDDASRGYTVIRQVLDLVVPTVDVQPEQSLLLDAIRSLLKAASISTVSQTTDAQEATGASSDIAHSQKSHSTPRFVPSSLARTIFPHGTQPHSALLPGISWSTSANDSDTGAAYNQMDSSFDFDMVDWTEFDRLVSGFDGM